MATTKKRVIDRDKLELDKFEQSIEDSFGEMVNNGKIKSVSNFDEVKKKLELAAANKPVKLTSTKISLRVKDNDLFALKEKANEQGLPYQTLINSILHQRVSGKLTST